MNEMCAGVGLVDAVLAGDRNDPRVAWLTNAAGEGRTEIVFPPGFTARFSPDLEIINRAGQVVLREGDRVDGACVTGEPGVVLLWLQ